MSDRASQALVQDLPPNVRRTYTALADHYGDVNPSTLWYRDHGRPSKEDKAQRQQYLTPQQEDAFVRYLLRMADLGSPVRIKFFPSLAFTMACQRPTNKATKLPGKNWPQAFVRRHPEVKRRFNRALDWNRHDNNIYDKVEYWFEVIEKELHRPDITPENVYNMDETGIMLSMQGRVKVVVGKDDKRDYRGSGSRGP